MGRYTYTDEELDILREFYPREGALGVAARIGRGAGSIKKKAREMGLRCNPGVRGECISRARRGDTPKGEERERMRRALRRQRVGELTHAAEEKAQPKGRHIRRTSKENGRGHGIRLNQAKLAALSKCGCMPNALAFLAWETEDGYEA